MSRGPEPGSWQLYSKGVGFWHLFFMGVGGMKQELGSLTQDTKEPLFREDRGMDKEREAVARGRSRVGLFPRVLGLPAAGWEGKEGGEEVPLRAWSLGFCYLVLFALARLI